MSGSSESPTAKPTASLHANLSGLTAPLLFGPLCNWALYGVLCIQIYIYSCNFPKDRQFLKIIAYSVFFLETVQTILTGTDVYFWFVAGFGDAAHLADSHLSALDVPVLGGVISLIVQGYFCHRIWTLNRWSSSRSSWVCWIIAMAAVTQSISATAAGIKSLIIGGKYVSAKTALCLWSVSSALADILIAVAMTLLLRRARGKFSSFVLFRVVRLTIETNALTASLAIVILVLYAAFPNELYYISVSEIIGKVYSNTLLLSLNNRIYFRECQPPLDGSTYLRTSGLVRATASSLRVASEPQSQESKGAIFSMYPLSRPGNLENGQ